MRKYFPIFILCFSLISQGAERKKSFHFNSSFSFLGQTIGESTTPLIGGTFDFSYNASIVEFDKITLSSGIGLHSGYFSPLSRTEIVNVTSVIPAQLTTDLKLNINDIIVPYLLARFGVSIFENSDWYTLVGYCQTIGLGIDTRLFKKVKIAIAVVSIKDLYSNLTLSSYGIEIGVSFDI